MTDYFLEVSPDFAYTVFQSLAHGYGSCHREGEVYVFTQLAVEVPSKYLVVESPVFRFVEQVNVGELYDLVLAAHCISVSKATHHRAVWFTTRHRGFPGIFEYQSGQPAMLIPFNPDGVLHVPASFEPMTSQVDTLITAVPKGVTKH